MTTSLDDRLEQVLPRVTSDEFLSGQGIGNEIACYIFDYSPADELVVRKHLGWMVDRLASHHRGLKTLHLDLLDVVTAYLSERGLLEKALHLQVAKGDAAMLSALKGPLGAEKVRDFLEADSLGYLSLEGLMSSVGSGRQHYCSSCYTGVYPVSFPQDERAYLQLALKLDKEPVSSS